MPTMIQTVSGRVSGLWGTAQIKGPDGKFRPLKMGEIVLKGDVILTSQNGIVQLTPDPTLVKREPDPIDDLPPTGAGPAGSAEFLPGLRVDRIVESVSPSDLLQGSDRVVPFTAFQPTQQIGGGVLPSVSVSSTTVNEAAGTATFTVTLSQASTQPVTVLHNTSNGTATAGQDYTATSGTLVFAPGETTKTITVPILNDNVFEGSEFFNVNLSTPTNAVLGAATGVGTIRDDGTGDGGPDNDTPRVGSVSAPTVTEGGNLDFVVTLTNPSTTPTTVNVSPASGTATLGTDTSTPILVSFDGGTTFTAFTGTTVSVPAGATSFIVRVPTVDDIISEPSETITLTASTPSNGIPVTNTGTIDDNDTTKVVSVEPGAPGLGDDTVPEGTPLVYTVTLSNPSSTPVSFAFTVGGGTASPNDIGTPTFTNGVTYNPETGQITVPAGVTSFTTTIPTVVDGIYEGPETLPVNIGGVTGTGTITDIPPSIVSVEPGGPGAGDDSVPEGTPLVYTVTLSVPSATPTTFSFTVGGGTASPNDIGTPTFSNGVTYDPNTGTITVPAGVTSFTTTIPTVVDGIYEGPETVPVNIGGVTGTGTITDIPPSIVSVEPGSPGAGDDTVPEGTPLVYTVTLSVPSTTPTVFPFTVGGGTASPNDYGTPTFSDGVTYDPTTGTITVPPGVSSFTTTIPTVVDGVFEGPETVPVTIGGVPGIGTITDEPPKIVSVEPGGPGAGDDSVPEGTPLVYTVTLSIPSGTPTTFPFTVGGGTASPNDYGTPTFSNGVTYDPNTGTITVPAGVTSFTTTIPTIVDNISEAPETVPVNIGGVTGTGTITDSPAKISIAGPGTVAEEVGTVTYTVTLSQPSTTPVTVSYSTVDGKATSESGDYVAQTATLTFAPGETTKTITVTIVDDRLFEGPEDYAVVLSTPIGASIDIGTATTTIFDDGATPKVASVSSPTVVEGGDLDFAITLTSPSTTPTTVTLAAGAGTATLGTDTATPILVSFDGGASFTPIDQATVTVPAGVTSFIVRVPTVDDALVEPAETVILEASTPANATPAVGTGTIVDNDGTPTLLISGPALINEAAGTVTYTVSLSNASATPVSVNYATADGTAKAGEDYTAATGTLQFAAGETTKTITVAITNDTVFEGSETFSVNLSAPSGAAITVGTVNSAIVDDGTGPGPNPPDNDTPKVGTVSSPQVTEGGDLDFTVTLTNTSTTPTTVTLTPNTTGTASAADTGTPLQVSFDGGANFVPVTGSTVAVPAGASSFIVRVPTIDDTITEPTETYLLGASTPANSGTPVVGTGSILDNDAPPVISIKGPVVIDEGAGTATYTISLSNASATPVSVGYGTVDGTATAGSDFTATSGTLSFAAGETVKTVTVAITNDSIFEGSEAFSVVLNTPTGATIGTGTATTNIVDNGTGPGPTPPDNTSPQVGSVSSPTAVEGGNLDFTVALTNPSTTPTTVTLAPSSGSGTLGVDTSTPILVSFDGGANFTPVTGSTVTVPAGATSFVVRVPTVDDTSVEPTETILLGAATPANSGAPVQGTGTIVDNDSAPALLITGPALINEAAGTVTYTVSLSSAAATPVSVSYATADGTARAGEDYTAATGTLQFAVGETTKTITVAISNDTVFEGSETFSVNLSTPVGASIAIGSVNSAIVDNGTVPGPTPPDGPPIPPDNDTPKVGTVSSPQVTEGGNLDFAVTLTNTSTTPTTVTLTPASGSATLGTDTGTPLLVSFDGGATFSAVTGTTVAVPAGASGFIVRVPTIDDTLTEPTESFTLGAATPANAGTPVIGTGTILDNDAAPTVSISGPAVIDEGAGTATYTVTLSNAASTPVSVGYATTNGSATANADYTAVTGLLNFAVGETVKTITVSITQDNIFEGPETFGVALNTPSGATIDVGTATSTIVDNGTGPGPTPPDDGTPKVGSVSSPTVVEGGNLDFTVSLTNTSTTPTSVALAPSSGTGTLGTDTGPVQVSFDGGQTYTAVTGPTVTVPAGVASFIVRIPTVDDTTVEPTETILLSAATPSNSTPVQGTGTIVDNDGTPSLLITGPAVIDEASGTVTYTVSLSSAAAAPVSVNYSTADGTATAGADYTAATGTLNFAAGETTKTISVAITNDTLFEGPETFSVLLSAASGANIAVGTVNSTIVDNGTGPGPTPPNGGPPLPPDNDAPKVGSVSSPTVAEGGDLDFTVTLTNASTTPTTVTLSPASGTATLGTDTSTPILVSFDGGTVFVPVSGSTVAVPAGSTSFIVRVPTVDDTLSEPNETMTLGAATPANTAPVQGTGTITDNDGLPKLSISGPAVVDEAAGTVTYTVTMSQVSSSAVTVNYSTFDGTAKAGNDYSATSGTLSFAAGETTKTITVAIVNDTVLEGPEQFSVGLSQPTNALISFGSIDTTIFDDGNGPPGPTPPEGGPPLPPNNDTPKVGSVSSPTVTEGGDLDFTVTLTNTSTTPTTVTLAPNTSGTASTADTATPLQVSFDGGATFTAVTGSTVAVPAGASTFIVRVPTIDDALVEPTETYTLGASTSSNAAPVQGTGTIVDNDGTPTLLITGPAVIDEAAGTATYTVSLSNPAATTVSVNYATANGTATAGSDYTAANGTLSFQVGETTKTITVAISNDTLFEGPETFSVVLSAPTGAAISVGSVDSTIVDNGTGPGPGPFPPNGPPVPPDNDAPKVESVSSPTIAEGGNLDFVITLSNASTTPTSVTLLPTSGTATLGTDTGTPLLVSFDGGTSFTAFTSSSVSVPAGATSFIVRVPTIDDTISEPNESFTLGALTNANAGTPVVGTGTITDNDGTPSLAITGPATIDEAAGTVTYTVSLSGPTSTPVTVGYATANGTATAGADYTAASGSLSFAAGETSKTITVAITKDTVFEGPETFSVNLTAPLGASIATGTVTSTIVDANTIPTPPDDDTPKVGSVSSPTVTEGGNLDFTVTLTNTSTTPTTVTLTPNAAGTASTADTDTPILVSFDGGTTFVAVTGSTVAVPAGAASFIVRVPTVDDTLVEPTETYTLGASTPANAGTPVQGTGSIVDNDGTPSLLISGPALINEAAGTVTYTVSLSSPAAAGVTVNYATTDGTAKAGSDYEANTGTLSFAAGETTKTITVAITNDSVFEGPETFSVNLSAPTGATIAVGTANSTIVDDGTGPGPNPPDNDTPKVGSVSSPTVTEGGNLDFVVALTNASTTPTTVTLTPASGSATLGVDTSTPTLVSFDGGTTFVPASGNTVTVPAGATSFIVRVPTVDDTITEPTESFTLGAATPANAGTPVVGTGTILDNDVAPTVSIQGPAIVDEAAGTATYTVTLSNAASTPVSVGYATANGTATAGSDYTAATGTLDFAVGETSKTITVAITKDNVYEGQETFSVNLGAPTGVSIATGTVQTIIADDGTGPGPNPPDNDTPKVGSVSSPTTTEGGNLDFTVTLTNTSTTPTTVTLAPTSGSATLGTDTAAPILVSFDGGTSFTAVTGSSVTVPSGASSFIVRVPTVDDNLVEPTETIFLAASTPANTGAPVQGTGTIVDNDGAPALLISGPALINEAAGTVTYTVSLSNPSATPVSVDYTTTDGTARAGSDYTAAAGTLQFAAGETTKTITVAITNDTVFEGSETFSVNLSAPTGATIAVGSVNSAIVDDGTGPGPNPPDNDTPKVGSVSSPTVTEGGNLDFTVTLTNTSTSPTTVSLSPASGTATLGVDTSTPALVSFDGGTTFVAVTGSTVAVPPGAASFIVRFPTVDDTITEPTESFTLTASTAANTGAPVVGTGTGTILDNDAAPTVAITGPVTVSEVDGTATYTVTLSNASSTPVTVTYGTADGTATAGQDYTANTGTLSFAAGETTKTVTVAITNDTVFEGAETFSVVLNSATGATIATGTANTTILDDGDTPKVSAISSPTTTEGNNLDFTVTLSNASTSPTKVALNPQSGTATLGTDTSTPIQVSFDGGTTFTDVTGPNVLVPAGVSGFIVRIPTVDDNITELSESLTLGASTAANIGAPVVGTGTILDNDPAPTISIEGPVTVNEDAGTVTYTVSLSNPSSTAVSVNYATADGTATAGADYTAATGTLSFAAGETTKTITVAITNDTVFEGPEAFSVGLSAPTGGTIGVASVTTTINDAEDTPKVSSISSPTVIEGGNLDFTVSLSNSSLTPTTVELTPNATGTASPNDTSTPILVSFDGGANFVPVSGSSVTVPVGATSFIVRVPTVDDAFTEPTETYTLGAATPANTGTPVVGIGSIIDNDGAPSLLITGPATIDETAGTATYTVSLSNPSSTAVSVNYATADGTATAGSDFTAISGTLSFAAGETTKTVTVAITNDAVFEGPETFSVVLSTPVGASIAAGTVTTTINDAEDTPKVESISSPTTTEGGNLDFVVALSNTSTTQTTVTIDPKSGTAILGTDTSTPLQVSFDGGTTFTALTGTTVTVPVGAAGFIVRVPTVDDNLSEPTETITLGAATPANATPLVGTGTILDNDGGPTLSISGPAAVNEVDGTVTYTVTLSNPSSTAVTVNYGTADGTATAGQDYTANSGTLTFAAGETTKTVTVAITNDTVFEGPETYQLALSNASGATIATPSVTTTINDAEDTPKVASISSPTTTEGGNLDFVVALTNTSTTATTVTIDPKSGTAILGTDTSTPLQVSFDGGNTFANLTGTTVTVPIGASGFIVRVPTVDDNLSEPTETITLGAATPANTTPLVGTGSILDNDGGPTLAITGPATVNEIDGTVTYTVTLSNPSSAAVTVNYGTVNGTATAGQDYTANSGTLTFASGETTKTVTVAITNDTVFEGPETYQVALSNATGATIATPSVTTTINDAEDTPKVASISSPTVTEGGNLDFVVALTNTSTTPTTVTIDPKSGTAILGTDTSTPLQVSFDGGTTFTNLTGTTVTVPVGAAGFIVRVPTVDDNISEPTETITLGAATPANATPLVGTGSILDNDGTPKVSITGPATVNETDGTVTYTVSLSNPSSTAVTVNYGTVNGTATAGQDYTANSGTLSFAAGETTKTVTVAITNDTVFEGPETFQVALSAPTGATINVGAVTTTINDAEDTPKVASISSPTVTEGGNLDFVVALTNTSTTATTVTIDPKSGTAILGTDTSTPLQVSFDGGTTFTNLTGTTVTVPVGAAGFIVRVPTVDDNISEPTETITLGAATPANATPLVGTGSILDNDGTPKVSISGPATVNETDGTVTYTVTLSNPSSTAVTVNYGTVNGTATAGQDYTANSGTLSFAAGETTKTVTVAITNDTVFEGPETFQVALSAPTGATINVGAVTTTINDAEDTPKVASISSPTVTEGGNLDFVVALTNTSTTATTVTIDPKSGTAILGTDTSTPLQVSFDGGTTFTNLAGTTVTVPVGAAGFIVRVPTVDDNLTEPTETITLGAATPANATPLVGTGTILDNDTTSVQSIVGNQVIEGGTLQYAVTLSNPSTTATSFTLTLGAAPSTASTPDYNPAGLSFSNGVTYSSATGLITVPAGVTGFTVSVPTVNDTTVETTETLQLTLGTLAGTGRILDNDAAADTKTIAEDSGPATGNVLTNDLPIGSTGATVAITGFTVAGVAGSFTAGQTATIANVGSVTIAANGDYSFTPLANYNGTVPTVTYTGTKTDVASSVAVPISSTLDINVTPVADLPNLTLTARNFLIETNFESVALTSGTFTQDAVASAIAVTGTPGVTWATNNATGTVEVGQATTYGVTGTPTTNKVLELERDYGNASDFYTNVTVQKGEVFNLSFDFAARQPTPAFPQNNAANSVVYVYWEGQMVQRLDTSSGVLSNVTLNLVASQTGTAKLEFVAGDSNSFGGLIDNLKLDLLENTGIQGYVLDLPSVAASLGSIDAPGADRLTLTITGLPPGATLLDGAGHPPETVGANGTVDISAGWDLASLSVIPPAAFSGNLTVNFNAIATDISNGTTATKSEAVSFNVLPDAAGNYGTTGNDTLSGSTGDDRIWGLDGNDTINGGNGNDTLIGGVGNDILNGEAGNDKLDGGLGNDVLNGGAGQDVLSGGKGNDTLTGGADSDVFRWHLGDGGTAGNGRAVDTITDFSVATVANGGDVLDLRDLLVGDLKGGNNTVGNLQNYLDITFANGNTEIRISTTGGFTNGNYNANAEDQHITLQGVDLRAPALGLNANSNEQQIIEALVRNGKLVTD